MSQFSIASYNLYQYAEPGTFWYEAEETNDYEPDQWAEKQAFIKQTLADMNADIVGFQEIFSVESFEALLGEAGYAHVSIPDQPAVDPNNPNVFRGPVVGLASKFPIRSSRLLPSTPEIEDDGLLSDDFAYRRGVIEAEVDVPGLDLPLWVYVCHFKSQGAFVDKDETEAQPDWPQRFQYFVTQRSLLDANQVIRRAGESMMLYQHVMEKMAADPLTPVAVIGDLNDDPESFTLRILTQNERVRNIAGRSYSKLEPHEKAPFYTWQLYSAMNLVPSQSGGHPPTHASWNHSSTLDYVLVSNALNGRNPRGKAEVKAYDVFNDHHVDEVRRLLSSDHAPIRATIEIKPSA